MPWIGSGVPNRTAGNDVISASSVTPGLGNPAETKKALLRRCFKPSVLPLYPESGPGPVEQLPSKFDWTTTGTCEFGHELYESTWPPIQEKTWAKDAFFAPHADFRTNALFSSRRQAQNADRQGPCPACSAAATAVAAEIISVETRANRPVADRGLSCRRACPDPSRHGGGDGLPSTGHRRRCCPSWTRCAKSGARPPPW